MIVVENLVKTFPGAGRSGEVAALRGVSLEIPDGEIYGIVGPSGSGKSTLLRCLNLLERPTSGRILLGKDDLSTLSGAELRAARRRIGTVFQQFNLLHSRTVIRNVEFPLEVAGIGKEQRRTRALELLDLVGLAGKGESYPSQLSGGQQQRVGIARALAAEPEVLLCDEATSALDPDTTDQVLDLVAEVNRRLGVTVVVITHELGVLRRICSSAARLDAGQVVETGRIVDLVADPESALGHALVPVGTDPSTVRVPTRLWSPRSVMPRTVRARGDDPRDRRDIAVVGGRVEQVGSVTVGRMRLRFTAGTERALIEGFVAERPYLSLAWGTEAELEGLTE
ncbi:methionine ABC transporter ATP-binding protein [Rhodococcus sp. IITR03]|nr:methionine ABC transporter ATP-binding protein [Rhodococcus sp. IITR03]